MALSHQLDKTRAFDLCIVGGAGHVGLPLSIVFASKGLRVLIYDHNAENLQIIRDGAMPFMEDGAEPLLAEVQRAGRLFLSADPAEVSRAATVVVVIGTPVDEFLNPSLKSITTCFDSLLPHLDDEQLVILRSTVYPGVTQTMARYLASKGKRPMVSFCPERIVEGKAIEELQTLPQIVSGTSSEAEDAAAELFRLIAPDIVRLAPVEAELVKLFSNAYRYIQFAVTNQFFLISKSAGVDYYRVLEGMKRDYPRMADVPRAGFAAGPCLFKDTMQLAAFCKNQFSIGFSAMLVNEGLPMFTVESLATQYNLEEKTIGLLGMAFKAESDDTRSSLSYKLKKLLTFRAKAVLTTDPYVKTDPDLVPVEDVITRSDILILCAPHRVYKNLNIAGRVVVDIWNFWGHASAAAASTRV